MTQKELLEEIQDELQAETWSGGSVVFASSSVKVTQKADLKLAMGSGMRCPWALIVPGDGQCDPQHGGQDPNLIIMPVTVIIGVQAAGDAIGEGVLLGANRVLSTASEGAGIFDILPRVYNAIGRLNTADGVVIQFRQMGESGSVLLDNNYIGWRGILYEAVVTVS